VRPSATSTRATSTRATSTRATSSTSATSSSQATSSTSATSSPRVTSSASATSSARATSFTSVNSSARATVTIFASTSVFAPVNVPITTFSPVVTSTPVTTVTVNSQTLSANVVTSHLSPEPLSEQAVNLAILILYSKEYQIFIHTVVVACFITLGSLWYFKKKELAIIKKKNEKLISDNINTERIRLNSVVASPSTYTGCQSSAYANIITSTPTDTRIVICNDVGLEEPNRPINSGEDYHSVESLEI
jgi:hypothetical protein